MQKETAISQVVIRIEKRLEDREIALGTFLDIEGPFDNTSAAREGGLDETCCRWIKFMLRGRLIHTSLMCSSVTAKDTRGCPQGGVLSPVLWNLVVYRHLSGYADGFVIIIQGRFAHTVREIMQNALNVVAKWVVEESLNISPHKTAMVPFTNRRKIEGLGPLKLHGKYLKVLDEVKYLGVILDSSLTWNQHLQKTIRKTQTTFALVRRTCGKKWGLRPSMVHCLYTRVIRPSILYGALVWWPKVIQKNH
jgi:hypothetical protein